MRRTTPAAFVTALLLTTLPLPARAELCTIDAVPAATLLLPYFEIDLSKFPNYRRAEQTIISLQNAGAAPALAHVTLWTDLSVPTLAFDVYLTGYDVEEINLTELFYTGAIAGLSTGEFQLGLVLGETPTGGLQSFADLIQAHRGERLNGKCWARDLKGNIARGYVTIDNVNQTSTLFPSDSGYFGAGGVAIDSNTLWGVVLVTKKKAIQADLLVHIEAGSFSSGRQTFYGRYVGYNGSDGREPLGSTWAVRYFSGIDRTDFIVWRDSTAVQEPFTCSQLGESGWYPLHQTQVVAFNETEDAIELFFDAEDGVKPGFPAETQVVRAASSAFKTAPYKSGWAFLNLRDSSETATQSYVWVRQGFRKRSALYPGLPHYDESNEGSPSDASACGPAPASPKSPIP